MLYQSHEGKVKLEVLHEKISFVMHVFKFDTNAQVLFRPFNHKLKQLTESGIVQRLIQPYFENKFSLDELGPSVLTMEHLKVGFQAWICCLLVSTLVFAVEVLVFYQRAICEALSSFY